MNTYYIYVYNRGVFVDFITTEQKVCCKIAKFMIRFFKNKQLYIDTDGSMLEMEMMKDSDK